MFNVKITHNRKTALEFNLVSNNHMIKVRSLECYVLNGSTSYVYFDNNDVFIEREGATVAMLTRDCNAASVFAIRNNTKVLYCTEYGFFVVTLRGYSVILSLDNDLLIYEHKY